MVDPYKLTENAAEMPFEELFKGDALAVPYFQRPYKWPKARIEALCRDLDSIIEDETTVHFLGAVIMFDPTATHKGEFKREEVIDGQQRITTVYLLLCAAVRVLVEKKAYEDALYYFKTHVIAENTRRKGYEARLQPSHGDREALNDVIEDILKTKKFRDELGPDFRFLDLKTSGKTPVNAGKRIAGGYSEAKRYFRSKFENGDLDALKLALVYLITRLTVVQIRVIDTLAGPKIFDSLNSKQEAMTVGDLIRNDIFKREVENDPDLVEELNDKRWLPFYNRFVEVGEKAFDDYFFPFGLTQDPNVKKSDVHSRLMKAWASKTPQEIIESLAVHQDSYLDLLEGKNVSGFKPDLALRMARFRESKAPTAVYPFILSVTHAFNSESLSEAKAIEILDVVERFLTRRAIAHIEPTGLHAVFKGLWRDIQKDPSARSTVAAIRKHKTVEVASNQNVEDSVRGDNAYSSKITPYVLKELDRALGGDKVDIVAHIEHVFPQTPKSGHWAAFTGREELRDRLANLIPLSAPMNQSLKNAEYAKKQAVFRADSAFKMARTFAEVHADWTPKELEVREGALVTAIVKRWPDV